MTMIQIEVKKKDNESTGSVLRRFTKKSKSSGLARKARSLRFSDRAKSDFVKKKDALKRIQKQKEMKKLYKLGKLHNVRGKKTR